MSRVRSTPIESSRGRDPLAPLPRSWLDHSAPLFRALLGAAFVAFSSYATVFIFARDIQPLIGDRQQLGPFPDRYWYGMLLALGFFLGEIYTAERYPRAYRAILTPDTIYTGRQLYASFSAPEIVQITMRLTEGMAPSDVAKTLPGYSARNYQAYMAKVRQVKAAIDTQPTPEPVQETA